MVTLIETLIGKGLQLAIYDRDVSLARLFGANKEYIEREIPHISQLMRGSVEEVMNDSEVIVLGNKSKEFEKVSSNIPNGKVVIDLVRVFDGRKSDSRYQGICW
jgi:GDP-mannose 6-dehydrogenase